MKIGLVDLDTSHPVVWTPLIRDLGHEVTSVWDGGTVYRAGKASKFCEGYCIEHAPERMEDLVDLVDGVIIHSCNWDLHVQRARFFIDAGKSVLIDKPVAGNLNDLNQIKSWAQSGKRVCGGSSLRFNYDSQAYLSKPVEERGEVKFALAGCGVDEFNYGIHAYSLLIGIMGGGVESVRFLSENSVQQAQLTWRDGRAAVVSVTRDGVWLPFYATVVSEKTVEHLIPSSDNLYRSLLEKCLPYMAGETDLAPLSPEDLIEPELAALAVGVSRNSGGKMVRLSELSSSDFSYDGAVFAADYRKQRGDY